MCRPRRSPQSWAMSELVLDPCDLDLVAVMREHVNREKSAV